MLCYSAHSLQLMFLRLSFSIRGNQSLINKLLGDAVIESKLAVVLLYTAVRIVDMHKCHAVTPTIFRDYFHLSIVC